MDVRNLDFEGGLDIVDRFAWFWIGFSRMLL
jgi:hypothetical protein